MLGYSELYELVRKEKYSEALQPLPKNFLEDFASFVKSSTAASQTEDNILGPSPSSNKQLENALAIFKELILKRKRKILNLVFVATETGIMKRDYEHMLTTEKEIFDGMVKMFEDGDKKLSQLLQGTTKKEETQKMVLFKDDVDPFVDHNGKDIGPFKSGDLANLDSDVAGILVSGEKATFVDED